MTGQRVDIEGLGVVGIVQKNSERRHERADETIVAGERRPENGIGVVDHASEDEERADADLNQHHLRREKTFKHITGIQETSPSSHNPTKEAKIRIE